jgi:hypothetical protein
MVCGGQPHPGSRRPGPGKKGCGVRLTLMNDAHTAAQRAGVIVREPPGPAPLPNGRAGE